REYIDQVTIAPGLVIAGQSIGVAEKSSGFSGTDGILGIGPTDLTKGTLSPDTNTPIPTVTDNAYSQGLIPAHEIGISFEPTTTTSITNGEISWGGPDSTKPLTKTSPASDYWGIDQSITYGPSKTSILTSTAGIVDT
ncbi:hypothetical protein H0H92_014775, partial [Tricholoma furcatifolium]